MPRSLLARLVLGTVSGLAVAVLAAGGIMYLMVRPAAPEGMLRDELAEETGHISDGLRVDPAGHVTVKLRQREADTYDAMPRDMAWRVMTPGGVELAHSVPGQALAALQAAWRTGSATAATEGPVPVHLRLSRDSIRHHGVEYVVQIARSDRLTLTLKGYAGRLYFRAGIATALLALLVFALIAWFTLSRLLAPVRRLSRRAARIGPKNLTVRLGTDGLPTELLPMVDSFNAALGRLENGYRVQQDFLASAAHELKTPLALLQAEIELGGGSNKTVLLRDTALMARQVHQLLHLAEVREGHNYVFATLRLSVVAAEVADYLERLAAQYAVRIVVLRDSSRHDVVVGDQGAVFILVKNLLENAVLHSPRGGTVRVRLHAAGFAVEDEGPGVPAADLPHVFERFWRGSTEAGEGAGLGLAICREICLAHGWVVSVAPGADGRGAAFVVETGGRVSSPP